MDYKNELSIIDTEQKSYLLGLLFADGCISTENRVRLSLIDKQLIDDIYKEFPFFNKGECNFGKYNINNKIQYYLNKHSKELQNDLIKNGLQFNKSIENAEKLKLPILENHLMNHFIRGYFDGNGSISTPTNRPNLRRIEICSSSKIFINQVKNYLELNNIECPYYRKKNNTKSILYVLEWITNNHVIMIKNYLYNNCTISLLRKKIIFDNFKIIVKTDNNPKCKKCNNNLIKNGSRKTATGWSYRYKCKQCNIIVTIPVPSKKLDELLETPKALSTKLF